MKRVSQILLPIPLLLLAASLMADTLPGSVLSYQVSEPGLDAYLSRILVTRDFVRMDDGETGGDFVLFDRKAKTIYSISHDDETIFVIPERNLKIESPERIERSSKTVQPVEAFPNIGGEQPRQIRLLVNGEACYNLVVVKTLLPEAVAALKEFREILSGEHKSLIPSVPADMRDPCDLALHAFYPAWQLDFGLPLREWDEQGKGQFLIDYQENFPVDEKWLTPPAQYRRYNSDGM